MAPRASSVPDTPMSALPLLLASLAVLAPLGSSGARPASQYIESAALNGTVPLLAAPSYSNRVASLGATYMDCDDAPVCGVLTLETGWGGGYYAHNYPVVHGLWPQTPPYGNSACLRPKR